MLGLRRLRSHRAAALLTTALIVACGSPRLAPAPSAPATPVPARPSTEPPGDEGRPSADPAAAQQPLRFAAFSVSGSRHAAVIGDGTLLAWELEGNPPRFVARALRFVPPAADVQAAPDWIDVLARDGRLFGIDDAMRTATEVHVDAPVSAFVRACSARFGAFCVVTSGALRCAPPCTAEPRPRFEDAGLSQVTQLAAGGTFACALRAGGTVHCWGDNDRGQLAAPGRLERSPRPRAVEGLRGVVELALGDAHGCARDEAGRVLCWGDATQGQTGLGAACDPEAPAECARAQRQPAAVPALPRALSVSAAQNIACAITGEPVALYCWGDRNQLGLSAAGDAKPVQVPLPEGFSPLGAEYGGVYALGDDLRVYRWDAPGQAFVASVDLAPAVNAQPGSPEVTPPPD